MISINDNNYEGIVYPKADISDILSIANKPIRQLCLDNEHLLVFPSDIDDATDKIGNSTILDIYAEDNDSYRIKTGNIMGFIGTKKQRIKIYSRFDNDKNDYFLHYMLQKVFSFNVFNLDFTSSNENVFDFMVYMFPALLKKAMKQGIYKEYQRFSHNDSNVRGTINISRHIKENIPFKGTISYDTREFSYDNNVIELIRHTIEYIKILPIGHDILSSDEVVKEYVRDIIYHTPSYRQSERQRIIQQNLRYMGHPFYTEYTPLVQLCIQILRQEELKYGIEEDRISGILFDGAWLWEEYLDTLLHNLGFKHPENKLGTGAIYLFENNAGQRFPDFWKNDCVLDAKYKRLVHHDDQFDVDRNDIHQMLSYMYRLKSQYGGFICPTLSSENKEISKELHHDSYHGKMYVHTLSIPQNCNSYDEFIKKIQDNETYLSAQISKNIGL